MKGTLGRMAPCLGLLLLLVGGCDRMPPPVTPYDFSEPPDLVALVSMEGVSYVISWSPDGSEILFGNRLSGRTAQGRGLYRASVADGRVTPVIRLDPDARLGHAAWSPLGDLIVLDYGGTGSGRDEGIYTVHPDGSGWQQLTQAGAVPVWSPDGEQIAFLVSGTDHGQRFSSLRPGVYVMRPDGTEVQRLTDHAYGYLSWSPDGTRIAFVSLREGNQEVYVVSVEGSGEVNLTNDWAADTEPAWSPDGSRILFVSYRGDATDIYCVNTDGSGPMRLTQDRTIKWQPVWSPDGSAIGFIGTNRALYVMDADGGDRRLVIDPPDCLVTGFSWSPDGEWLAFTCGYEPGHPAYEITAAWIYLVRVNR